VLAALREADVVACEDTRRTRVLLDRYGVGTLPASAFGEEAGALRLRLATGLLYGGSDEQREATLASDDPLALPWVQAALAGLEEVLGDLGGSVPDRQQQRALGRDAVA